MARKMWVRVVAFILVIIAMIIPTLMTKQNRQNPYMVWLRGLNQDFKGMLRVWNVASPGDPGISAWLREILTEFEHGNFGVFAEIETMELPEFEQRVNSGEYPDFVVHASGTFNNHELFEKINIEGPRETLMISGEGYALPLAADGSVLLVNDGYLMDHEIDAPENMPGLVWMAQVSDMLTFDYDGQKETIHVKGFAMAADPATLAYGWMPADWESMPGFKINGGDETDSVEEFINEKVGMLFCTMGDYKRVYDKSSLGEAPAYLPFALHAVSTKVHYISLVKTEDERIRSVAKKLMQKLISEEAQSLMTKVWQLPSVKIPYIYSGDEALNAIEKACENEIAAPWCFNSSEQIKTLNEVSLKALKGDKNSASDLLGLIQHSLVIP